VTEYFFVPSLVFLETRESVYPAVICFGIPFPNVKEEAVAKKKQYNDGERKFGKLSGAEWYRQQAFRALNQALGRCIRHKNDFGAILLLEERMREPRNLSSLSKWLRERVRVWDEAHEALEHLSRYFSSKPKGECTMGPNVLRWTEERQSDEDAKTMAVLLVGFRRTGHVVSHIYVSLNPLVVQMSLLSHPSLVQRRKRLGILRQRDSLMKTNERKMTLIGATPSHIPPGPAAIREK